MDRKDIYLDDRAIKSADVIIEAGFAGSVSGAVRIALVQFAAIVAPRTSASTP
jgi:hypothetical protein